MRVPGAADSVVEIAKLRDYPGVRLREPKKYKLEIDHEPQHQTA
jgi:hypothetical protein